MTIMGQGLREHIGGAAYLSIIGSVALVVTLGAGLFLPGRHGS